MKVLILGGTRFFGRSLVKQLIKENKHEITILTRSQNNLSEFKNIQHIQCDRKNFEQMNFFLKDTTWDLVYDQICYDYTQAQQICEILNEKTKKLIFTSTGSVYDQRRDSKETDFDASNYKFDQLVTQQENYGEAKRQAECGFYQNAQFPVTYARFPIVLGPNDYTKRLLFHIQRIQEQKEIYFPKFDADMVFVHQDDAAQALIKLGKIDFSGPINIASPPVINLTLLIKKIEIRIDQTVKLATNPNTENHSPYGVEDHWTLNSDKMKSLGISFPSLLERIDSLIDLAIEK